MTMAINNLHFLNGILVVGTLLLPCPRLCAQGFVIEHGAALAQYGVGVVPVADGFLIGTRSYQQNPDGHVAAVWSTGTNGSDLGTITLTDLVGRIFLHGMIASADGSTFLYGSSIPENGHAHDGFVIKRALDGSTLWTTLISMDGDQHFLGGTALPDGGVVVCGTTNSAGNHDALITRFSPDGATAWSVTQGFESDEEAYGIAVQGNDIMVTGRQLNFGGTSDAWFARVGLDGTVVWTTSWGGISNDAGRGIVTIGPGAFVMAGTTNSYGTFDHTEQRIKDNIYLVAIDLNGDSLWTRAIGDTLYDRRAFTLAAAANGDLLIGGERSSRIGASDSYGMRTGPDGMLIWERAWDLGKEERLLDIEVLPDGMIATGWAFNESSHQIVLIRKDPDGN